MLPKIVTSRSTLKVLKAKGILDSDIAVFLDSKD